MSADQDHTGIVRSWLQEGDMVLPDRVIGAVLDRLPATRQRRALGPWALGGTNLATRVALGAAAVGVSAVIGVSVLSDLGTPVDWFGPPDSRPVHDGELAPGRYHVDVQLHNYPLSYSDGGVPIDLEPLGDNGYAFAGPTARVTFEVPAGWVGLDGGITTGDLFTRTQLTIQPQTVDSVYIDPCRSPYLEVAGGIATSSGNGADPPLLRSLDGLATALSAWWGGGMSTGVPESLLPSASAPTQVTLAGLEGRYVEIETPRDIDIAPCDGVQYILWADPLDTPRRVRLPGEVHRLWLFDVDGFDATSLWPRVPGAVGVDGMQSELFGGLIVIDATVQPGASGDALAEMDAIIDSLEIDLLDPPSQPSVTEPMVASPAPTPSDAAGPPSGTRVDPSDGQLAPGMYFVTNPNRGCRNGCADYRRITFTLPAGWALRDGIFHKHLDQPDEVAFSAWTVDRVYADPCHWLGSALSDLDLADDETHEAFHAAAIGSTVESQGTGGLANQAGRNPSPLISDTLAGQAALRIELSVPADLDISTCDGGEYRSWSELNVVDGANSHHAPGQIDVVYMVDVDSRPLVIVASHMPAASEEDLAELEAILAGMIIDR